MPGVPKLWADSIDEHRTLVRGRLIAAFVELLDERPLDQVTMSAVTERADLARSAAYNHVDHVHDLALLHVEDMIGAWLEPLQADVAATAYERLDHLIRSSFTIFATDRLGGMDLTGHLDPSRSARLFELLRPIMVHLRGIIEVGVDTGEFAGEDPDVLAQFVWATIGGHRTMLGSGQMDPDKAAELASRMLLRALSPRV